MNRFLTTLLFVCLSASTLKTMEDGKQSPLSFEEFLKEKEKLYKAIAPIARPDHDQTLEDLMIHAKYSQTIGQLAFRTNMPNQKKLYYITADSQWGILKEVIIAMIEGEHTHPDSIKHFKRTPLRESVKNKDFEFTIYLLQKGATITPSILKTITSPEIASLLQDHISETC
jgi:hypothetical protein